MLFADGKLHILDGSCPAGTNHNQLNCQFLVCYLLCDTFTKINGTILTILLCTTRTDLGRDIYSRWGHQQIVRGVCSNYSDPRSIRENFTFPRGCNVLSFYCYPVRLD